MNDNDIPAEVIVKEAIINRARFRNEMDLRDYFAGQALVYLHGVEFEHISTLAIHAYQIADQMMRVRDINKKELK